MADSDPAREHRETLHKARALLVALSLEHLVEGLAPEGAP
jgi:anthranilate/para-aminobenzoate synthase component I